MEQQPVTFPTQLQPLIDKVLSTCREQLVEGSVTPVTFIINSIDQTIMPIEMIMPNNTAKDISAAFVRNVVKASRADATIFVTEAWTLDEADSKNYAAIREKYGQIADYPGKVDILMVNVQTASGEQYLARARIEHKGKARRCGPLEVVKASPEATIKGRFSNYFQPDKEEP